MKPFIALVSFIFIAIAQPNFLCAQVSPESIATSANNQDHPATIKMCDEYIQKAITNEAFRKDLPGVYYYKAYSHYFLQQYNEAADAAVMMRKLYFDQEGLSDTYYQSTFSAAVYSSYASRYDKAVLYLEEVLTRMRKDTPPQDLQFLNISIQLGGQYAAAGATHKASEIYEETFATVKKHYTPADSIYGVLANYLTTFYYQVGYFERAEPFFIQALELTEKQSGGKNNEYYLASLKNLMDFYAYGKLTKLAIQHYPEFLALIKKLRGATSEDYITVLNAYGELLLNSGEYNKAEKAYDEFLLLCEKAYGKKSASYATALNNLAVVYEKLNQFKEAEKLYLKSLELKEAVYTKQSSYYALTLLNIGVLYDYLGDQDKSASYLSNALSVYESLKDTSDEYAIVLNNVATVYSQAGKSAKAIEMLEKSLAISLKKNGEYSSAYFMSLNNIAGVYVDLGEFQKALTTYVRAIAIGEKIYGRENTELGITINNLAQLKTRLGNYAEAGELYQQALAIQEKAVGKNHSRYLNVLQSMAGLEAALGNYRKAEEYYQVCENGYRKLLGKLHPDNSIVLSNFGQFYLGKGDYQNAKEKMESAYALHLLAYGEDYVNNIPILNNLANLHIARNEFKIAEEYIDKAITIATAHYGNEHLDYAALLSVKATLYNKLTNYDKAEECYTKSLAVLKKKYGEYHQEYANGLNNIGTVFLSRAMGLKKTDEIIRLAEKAKANFIQVLKIDSVTIGARHIDHALHLNNLAEVYRLLWDTTKAEQLYLKAIAMEEEILGKGRPNTATGYHNLASFYAGIGKFQKAENLAKKSIDIYELNYGKDCAAMADATTTLAIIYDKRGETEKSYSMFKKAQSIHQRELEHNFSFLSEDEKSKYLDGLVIQNNYFNLFAVKHKVEYPQYASDVYQNQTYFKGILLRSSSQLKEVILTSGDTSLLQIYDKWIDTKQHLVALYSSVNVIDEIHRYEETANNLEKQLVEKSVAVKSIIETPSLDWKIVAKNLKPNQFAIEFFEMRSHETGEETIAAIVIGQNIPHPDLIALCNANQLKEALGNTGANGFDYVNSTYGTKAKSKSDVFQLIWKPLEKYTANCSELFYSPAGDLHRVPMHGLTNEKGELLIDKIAMHQVQVTNTIQPQISTYDWKKASMLVVGGVEYDTKRSSDHIWDYLPGTKRESEQILALAQKSGLKLTSFSGAEASEDHVKELEGKTAPDFIHIATHGFFYNDPEQAVAKLEAKTGNVNFRGTSRGVATFVENSNPLMRSGIALAGANDAWSPGNENNEDGILTAYEVSLLNLQKTKLVVLSACETGLGDIKGNEGVYGLQRAFRMAGVQRLMMSLWKVPDKETEEFMVTFYTNLLKNQSIHTAFQLTQKTMSAKYDPYYWAAFVLME